MTALDLVSFIQVGTMVSANSGLDSWQLENLALQYSSLRSWNHVSTAATLAKVQIQYSTIIVVYAASQLSEKIVLL